MTAAQITAARLDYRAAQERAERAAYHGDHAGSAIAKGQAAALLRRLIAAMEPKP